MPSSFIQPALPARPSRRYRTAPSCCNRQPGPPPTTFSVCTGPTCSQTAFGKSLPETLSALSSSTDPPGTVERVGCLGECGRGPNVGVSRIGLAPGVRAGVTSAAAAIAMLHELGLRPREALVDALKRKERADALFVDGNVAQAVVEYERVVEGVKEFPALVAAARANRAGALLELGRVEEALREANGAIDMVPGSVGGWKRKMSAHEKRGEREMAVRAGEVLLRLLSGKDRELMEKRVRKLKNKWFWQR